MALYVVLAIVAALVIWVIAAYNSPANVTISGSGDDLNRLRALLERRGVACHHGARERLCRLDRALCRGSCIVLSHRLRLSSATTPEKIERDLMQLAPEKDWSLLSHWLIWHGRRRCAARNPDCPHCEVQALCPSRVAG